MRYLINAIYMALIVMLASAALTFGIDRELARRDFEKAIHDGDFEKPIVGCLFEKNCKMYTEKLYNYEGGENIDD